MMKSELKIKIVSLGSECTLIRLEEGRLKRRARKARARGVSDAAFVRSFWSLRDHRAGLRSESRAALLALAFLRGRAYADVEAFSRSGAPFGRAAEIAKKFGGDRWSMDRWAAWHVAADIHAGGFAAEERRREAAKRARAEAKKVTAPVDAAV